MLCLQVITSCLPFDSYAECIGLFSRNLLSVLQIHYSEYNYILNPNMQVFLSGQVKFLAMNTSDYHGDMQRDYQSWVAKIESTVLRRLEIEKFEIRRPIKQKRQLYLALLRRFDLKTFGEYHAQA